MGVRRAFMGVVVLAAMAGCAKPQTPTYARSFTDQEILYASYMTSFRAAEPGILRALAEKDSRLYARMAPKPTRDQLSDDTSEWRSRSYENPLSFGDREAAISDADEQFVSVRREELSFESGGLRLEASLRTLAIDQELFGRLIAEETERLTVERESPRAALTLIRAMVDAWPVVVQEDDELDKWISYSLGELRKELKPGVFSEAERDTMRIDLATLASKLVRLPTARRAAFEMDDALLRVLTSPFAVQDQAALESQLHLFVDPRAKLDSLEPAFDEARDALKGQLDAAMSVLDAPHRARVLANGKALLMSPPPCMARVPVRTPRDMSPPPERALACALVRNLGGATTDEAELSALVALYDAATVGDWAVAMHGRLRDPKRAVEGRSTLSTLDAEDREVLLREASAKPMGFIAAGLAAFVLIDRGGGHARSRAASWRAFGETPIDVAAAVLVDRR